MWSSHTYHEPSATLLVILTSFLYFLNLFGWIAQKLVSAGLLGQILIGIIYGTPVAGWLGAEYEEAIVGIGYVGLLIVVFEGGMTTSLDALLLMLPLSICVALTGLLTPIALSFILTPAFGFPLIHSFAAGAALSSTSLGTILTVLQPRVIGFDIRQSKLGVVLLSAAVMDDVVAFIFAKLLSIIGSGSTGSRELGVGIGRTIGVTVGLAVVAVPISRWILKPLYDRLMARKPKWEGKSWGGQGLILMIMAVLFIGMVAAAGYGGTSPLYGVYLAGLITSYLSRNDNALPTTTSTPESQETRDGIARTASHPDSTIAMNPIPTPPNKPSEIHAEHVEPTFLATFETYLYPTMTFLLLPLFFGSIGYSIPFVALWTGENIWKGIVYAILMILAKAICGLWLLIWPTGHKRGAGWRAALFLGLAMVARGEIGLLISQIAYHTPDPLYSEKEFLIVIWAILLATIIGPIGAGWVIKRWREDVLRGGWD